MDLSTGHLLDGRVIHTQPVHGHRTGIEPVLLAASVPARPGQRVLECGCGSGAGLLCLAARVPGLLGLGVEIDPAVADLAIANIHANGFDSIGVTVADIGTFATASIYDHAFANPPWHDATGTASPDANREQSKRAGTDTFRIWAAGLSRALRHRGTLTFVLSAAALADCLGAFSAAGCGSFAIMPLWPRHGAAAKLVLLRAHRGGRGPTRLLSGLALHRADGSFTAEADAVLRDGAALSMT